MSLTKNQFDILVYLEKNRTAATQRKLAVVLNKSVGTINKLVFELGDMGYMEDGIITDSGIMSLEPYRVKRAVFIAAGFGSRLVPITLNTPKPLVRVNGTRIIDTLIDAVIEAGIEEIIIVRGYLGEQFDQLLYKYPNIKFIDNPMYNEANNISSVVCAKDYLKNAYVFEADLFLRNKSLVKKYQYSSNYLGIHVDTSDDWCLKVTNGCVSKLSLGGRNCYQLVGISYWTQEDGEKLAEDSVNVFSMPGGKERYWDQIALEFNLNKYIVSVRECDFEDVVEIDTMRELKSLDQAYEN